MMLDSRHRAFALSHPRRRAFGLAASLLAASLGLTGCGGGIPEPTEAAEAFGASLSDSGLTEVPANVLTETSVDPAVLADAIAALEPYPVTVTLEDVQRNAETEDPVTATASYRVSWDLDPARDDDTEQNGADWSYSTDSTMVWNAETEIWQTELTAQTLVPGLADDGRVDVRVQPARRGAIQDTQGHALATDRAVQRIGIDKMRLAQSLAEGETPLEDDVLSDALTDSATRLAEVLELDAATFVTRTLEAGERAWVEFIVLRVDDQTEIPTEAISQIPGAVAQEDTMVLAPTRSFARSLLGTFGEPNAEQIENSNGTVVAGQATGLTGLQRMYNDLLAGSPGLEISLVSATDQEPAQESTPDVVFERAPQDGAPLVTTLDTEVQNLAEQTLADAEVPAGLVVIRPSDGHIVAAAEGPEDVSWPLAMTGSYPPGSTFKMVTALAMLRDGMTPESLVDCPATITIDGTEISNFDGYPSQWLGQISLADAIAQSCNTSFVGQWQELTPQDVHDAAVALGLVANPMTGYDGAFLGNVPVDVEGTQHASGLFGQGLIQASPLGMATVAASITAGTTVTPTLVQDPAPDAAANDALPGAQPLTPEEATTLLELMSGPVENGTVPILQDVPGAPVYAKTGTAEYVDDGEDLAHTWIMASHGDLAVALFYTEGLAGAQTNGPVLQEFLTELETIIPSTDS